MSKPNPMKVRKASASAPIWTPVKNETCELYLSELDAWVRCRITEVLEGGMYKVEAEVEGALRKHTVVRSVLREGNAPASKKDQIVRFLKTGRPEKALAMAAKFQDLGEHKDAITKGANALKNPDFYRQIKQDPQAIYQNGVNALIARYLTE